MKIYILLLEDKIKTLISKLDINKLSKDKRDLLFDRLKQENASFTNINKRTLNYISYCNTQDYIIWPRYMNIVLQKFFRENNIQFEVIDEVNYYTSNLDKNMSIKLDIFKHNQLVIDIIHEILLKYNGAILKLDTGSGKTLILNALICKLKQKTIIVVKNKSLGDQMYEDIHNNVNLPERCNYIKKEISVNYGNEEFKKSVKFCKNCNYVCLINGNMNKHNKKLLESGNYLIAIIVINTALNKPPSFWQQFGFAIFDECQNYVTDKRTDIYNLCRSKYMFGLSANPDKPWNYKLLTHNIGPIVNGNNIIPERKLYGNVQIYTYNGDKEYTKTVLSKTNKVSIPKMVELMYLDDARCQFIVDILIEAINRNENIFVFGLRNDLITKLYNMLIETWNNSLNSQDESIKLVPVIMNADSTEKDKEIAKYLANVIFTNYAYSEGINIPRFKSMLIASPYKGNGIQITGRIIRKDFDEERTIYDILDNNYIIKKQLYTRIEVYKQRNFEINWI